MASRGRALELVNERELKLVPGRKSVVKLLIMLAASGVFALRTARAEERR